MQKNKFVKINYVFTDELLFKLDKNIPSKIKSTYKFSLRRSGYVRFDKGEFNSLYVNMLGDKCDVIKFDNNLNFKYFYDYYTPSKKERDMIIEKYDIPDGRYTSRRDVDLNVQSRYLHHRNLISDNRIWFNTKFEENNKSVDKHYIYDGLEPIITVENYLNILEEKNIINKIQEHNLSWFFKKRQKDESIYLAVGEYRCNLNGEPYND